MTLSKNVSRPALLSLSLILVLAVLALSACGQEEPGPREKWETSAHADTESAAFTNWNDRDPAEIPENCAKCHSTHGYLDFLGEDGSEPGVVNKPAPVGTTVECDACHNDTAAAKTAAVMPSSKTIDGLDGESNCMECHQGRASGAQIQEAIDGLPLDTVNSELSFVNIHSNPAGPTQYGALAAGGYEYAGRDYAQKYDHAPEFSTCTECHDAHTLQVRVDSCSACHLGANTAADLPNIRVTNVDYDGDGDVTEGIAAEVEGVHALLYRFIQLKALQDGAQISYEDRRPYFFDESGEEFKNWTPRLMRAAFNYHYVAKNTGGYAHHPQYLIQLMYDSLDDLGSDTRFITRPES